VAGSPVVIKDWVWVANQVTILAGVTIEEGAVVASGAVVTHDVEPWTLVAGVPAKFVRNRKVIKYTLNTDRIEKLP
jgi:maltose O-acetyltransferase